jgi:hypothetical protein
MINSCKEVRYLDQEFHTFKYFMTGEIPKNQTIKVGPKRNLQKEILPPNDNKDESPFL